MKRIPFLVLVVEGVIELVSFSFFEISGWSIDLDCCDVEWFALESKQDLSVIFEVAHKYYILDSFVDYEGYSISSKRYLLNSPTPFYFSSLIPKILIFNLSISCLTMSNLPWFNELTSLNTLATWCKELTHWKRPWCWERLKAGRKGDDKGWDGWLASLTLWSWVWASSGSW